MGVNLGLIWGCFGVVLGLFWGCFGVVLGWFWGGFGGPYKDLIRKDLIRSL